jgi:hypothetical protein
MSGHYAIQFQGADGQPGLYLGGTGLVSPRLTMWPDAAQQFASRLAAEHQLAIIRAEHPGQFEGFYRIVPL